MKCENVCKWRGYQRATVSPKDEEVPTKMTPSKLSAKKSSPRIMEMIRHATPITSPIAFATNLDVKEVSSRKNMWITMETEHKIE